EDDTRRQHLERKELLVGDGVVLARYAERDRLGAGGEDDVARRELDAGRRERVRTPETRPALEGLDTRLAKAACALRRHRIGEGALERNEIGPVDRRRAADTAAGEPPRSPHRLRARHQHLLGVAAAQGARAAERPEVDDRDAAPGLAHPGGYARGRGATADHDEIVLCAHRLNVRTASMRPGNPRDRPVAPGIGRRYFGR